MVFNLVDSLLNRFSTLNGVSSRCIPVIYTRFKNIKNVKQQTSCGDPGLVVVGVETHVGVCKLVFNTYKLGLEHKMSGLKHVGVCSLTGV